MVAQLLQDVDSFQRLGASSTKKFLNLRGGDEQAIQCRLEWTEVAENDMLVLDWDCDVSCQSVFRDSRYLDSKSLVRRMMNLLTRPPSSLSFSSLSDLSFSLASASRPLRILSSKFLRKSSREPRYSGLAKLSKEKYSERSF